MKQKTTLILITCLLTASLLLAIGTVTLSWYQSRNSAELPDVAIPADGYIVVGFDEDPEIASGSLLPAVAIENAVRDNRYFDVTRAYNIADENPSWIKTVAQEYTFQERVTFYGDPTYKEDNGLSEDAIVTYDLMLTAQAYVKSGEEETRLNINTKREICFEIVANIDYANIEDKTDVIITPGNAFNLKESATITLTITVWLALPDELCDPALLSNDLYLEFGINVEPKVN